MIHYVLGFAFSPDKSTVLLIKKNHPKWQKGYLNGIGGKVEPEEFAINAMMREFKEETSIKTSMYDWECYAYLEGNDWDMRVYRSFTVDISEAKTITDEEVGIYHISNLNYLIIIPNLHWLIPLALDKDKFHAHLKYS